MVMAALLPLLGKFAGSAGGQALIGAGASSLLGKLFGGGKDTSLEDLRTEEQKRAARLLTQLGETGSIEGLTLGEAFQGPLGDFELTQGSREALSGLQSLLQGREIGTARDTLTKLADVEFRPDDPSTGLASFQRALARAKSRSQSALEREKAITGSRFGTGILREKADLDAQEADQLGQFLAQLFNRQQDRALSAATELQNLVRTQAGLQQDVFGMSDFERQLRDTKAGRELAEFSRQRQEKLGRIGILQKEADRNPFLGVSSIPGSPSPFTKLAGSILGGLGERIGSGGFSDLFKGIFKRGSSGTGTFGA